MSIFRKRCLCLRAPDEEIDILDYSHSGLNFIPSDVFMHERTLEELFVNNNRIQDLPRELFYCHSLRKLNIAENEVVEIPPVIGSLSNLEYLDISKNAIVKLPDSLDNCKKLKIFEASVNPMECLSEGLCRLVQLSELYLNDCFLEVLPSSFGRLSQLKVLEIRENQLKALPTSMSAMLVLERLDIGMNRFSQLPEVMESLINLQEFWFDSNEVAFIPKGLGNLSKMTFLDGSKNMIEWVAPELDHCVSLNELDLSHNILEQLPESIGRLCNLTKLKIDTNCLTKLPFSIGGMASLVELNISANNLEELPIGIGLLRRLRTFLADDNFLNNIPIEIGSCSALTILSLRSNNLTYIPDEIGHISNLRILNLSDNKLTVLPYSVMKLQELKALWLAETQSKPLIRLQSDVDPETGQRFLTSYLLPQKSQQPFDADDDGNSFQRSVWEEGRGQRRLIQFDFQGAPPEQNQLYRTPTPYPKELKQRLQHIRNLATKKPCDVADKPEFVRGRRNQRLSDSSVTLGNAQSPSKATSPLMSGRHVLLKANKEKFLKDKARMLHKNERMKPSETTESQSLPVNKGSTLHSEASSSLERRQEDSNKDLNLSELKDAKRSQSHRNTDSFSQIAVLGGASPRTNSPPGYYIDQEKTFGASEATVRNLKILAKNDSGMKTLGTDDNHRTRSGKSSSQSDARTAQNTVSGQWLSNDKDLSMRTDLSSNVSAPIINSDGIEIMSYKEFIDSMAAQGRVFPSGGRRRRPPSAYVYQRAGDRRYGYDSDTGHCSNAGRQYRRGYESDVDYREDFRRPRDVGYRSDTDYLQSSSTNRAKSIYYRAPEFQERKGFNEKSKMFLEASSSGNIQPNKKNDLSTNIFQNKENTGVSLSSCGSSAAATDLQFDKLNRHYKNCISDSGSLQSRDSSCSNQTKNLSGSCDGGSRVFAHEMIREENEIATVRDDQQQHQASHNMRKGRLQSQEVDGRFSAVVSSNTMGPPAVGFARLEGKRNNKINVKSKSKDLVSIEL